MILQSLIFKDEICDNNNLFFRSMGNVKSDGSHLYIGDGGQVTFDTYMNIFDLEKWCELTSVNEVYPEAECKGEGEIRLVHMDNGKRKILARKHFDFSSDRKVQIKPAIKSDTGYLQIEVESTGGLIVKDMRFCSSSEPDNNIRLALIICSYGKGEEVLSTTERLKGINDIKIYVVDNKKEIPERESECLTVCHNENTGGSGGFAKGLELVRKDWGSYGFSHVIFMDDDAYVNPEAIKRTIALLSYMKDDNTDRSVAGRMFLLEEPWVQYTASEIWNLGDIEHVQSGYDMTRREILPEINKGKGGQYSGFWFSCVPYSFAKDNNPLQLFLHCDDVEYGLRMNREPVILNGIQVWHESPLRRGNRIAAYYDIRNSMIVNSLGYDDRSVKEAAGNVLRAWRKRLKIYQDNHDCDSEGMALLAMEHFLEGPEWVYKTDGEKLHQRLNNIRSAESIVKRPLRIAYKLPCGKINELKRFSIEKKIKDKLLETVSEYRKAGADYANENI